MLNSFYSCNVPVHNMYIENKLCNLYSSQTTNYFTYRASIIYPWSNLDYVILSLFSQFGLRSHESKSFYTKHSQNALSMGTLSSSKYVGYRYKINYSASVFPKNIMNIYLRSKKVVKVIL